MQYKLQDEIAVSNHAHRHYETTLPSAIVLVFCKMCCGPKVRARQLELSPNRQLEQYASGSSILLNMFMVGSPRCLLRDWVDWKYHSIAQDKQIKMNAHPNTSVTELRLADWTNIIIAFKSLKVAFLRCILLSKIGDNFFDLKKRRHQTIGEMLKKRHIRLRDLFGERELHP